jgi:hypothetical protein
MGVLFSRDTKEADTMSRLRRIGLALVFAVTMAGTVLVSTPAEATTLPGPVCARLAAAIDYLEDLAARYPDNELIAKVTAAYQAAYEAYCQS